MDGVQRRLGGGPRRGEGCRRGERLRRGLLRVSLMICGLASCCEAAAWTRRYIDALPDSAFACVETDAGGRKHRHLPHHDASGRVDLPHLRSALSRWRQVRWVDPRRAPGALEHLRRHWREASGGGPTRGSSAAQRGGDAASNALPLTTPLTALDNNRGMR